MSPSAQAPDSESGALRRKIEILDRLVQAGVVLNSTLDLKPLLQVIMQTATEITRAEAASILLVDKNTFEMRFASSTTLDPQAMESLSVPVEGSVAGMILSEDRAIIIDDARTDPRRFRKLDKKIGFETRSLLGVPMRSKQKVMGVLEVLNKGTGRFDDEDVQNISILASHAAVAIENAQLIEALRDANEQLSGLDRLKSNFIAIASHELRTPLALILGYASFLREDTDGTASEYARRVLESALHLRILIESMTNLQYLQSEGELVNLEAVPLADIMTEACQDFQPLIEAKNQLFELETPPQSVTVRADRLRLKMALVNVLNNAARFTPSLGTITLSAEARAREAWVRVQDTGVGLASSQLERIFDQFYQVEDHLTRRQGGMGLGLSIARSVIQAQGGRIWAESAGEGKGSTFIIALPLAG